MLVSSVFAWGQMPENSQILVLNLNWLDFVFIAKILITFQINWPFQFYDFILAVWFDMCSWMNGQHSGVRKQVFLSHEETVR